jgi:hypothetical protein
MKTRNAVSSSMDNILMTFSVNGLLIPKETFFYNFSLMNI